MAPSASWRGIRPSFLWSEECTRISQSQNSVACKRKNDKSAALAWSYRALPGYGVRSLQSAIWNIVTTHPPFVHLFKAKQYWFHLLWHYPAASHSLERQSSTRVILDPGMFQSRITKLYAVTSAWKGPKCDNANPNDAILLYTETSLRKTHSKRIEGWKRVPQWRSWSLMGSRQKNISFLCSS